MSSPAGPPPEPTGIEASVPALLLAAVACAIATHLLPPPFPNERRLRALIRDEIDREAVWSFDPDPDARAGFQRAVAADRQRKNNDATF